METQRLMEQAKLQEQDAATSVFAGLRLAIFGPQKTTSVWVGAMTPIDSWEPYVVRNLRRYIY
jgi:hypothetical protein